MKKLSILLLAALMIIGISVKAQTIKIKKMGAIVKKSGREIKNVRIIKIKKGKVVYSRIFYRVKTSEKRVLYLAFNDGTKKIIHPVTSVKNYKDYGQPSINPIATGANDSLSKKAGKMVQKSNTHLYHIERIGKKFRLDSTKIVNTHQLNSILAQSGNPMVAVPLKAAKVMHTIHTLIKITSFPSTPSGAFASYKTFTGLFQQLKDGPAPLHYYMNAGLSFLGTLAFPIMSKILSHAQAKLYDKALEKYSAGQ